MTGRIGPPRPRQVDASHNYGRRPLCVAQDPGHRGYVPCVIVWKQILLGLHATSSKRTSNDFNHHSPVYTCSKLEDSCSNLPDST